MIRNSLISFCFLFFLVHFAVTAQSKPAPKLNTAKICPNIVLIYADDVGFGDISANGATKVHTPNIDQIAKHGINFTNAYATASVCTPSRFSLLTGKYAWRQKGTGVAPGNAALLISVASTTLASVFQKSGYNTGVVNSHINAIIHMHDLTVNFQKMLHITNSALKQSVNQDGNCALSS